MIITDIKLDENYFFNDNNKQNNFDINNDFSLFYKINKNEFKKINQQQLPVSLIMEKKKKRVLFYRESNKSKNYYIISNLKKYNDFIYKKIKKNAFK
jgi:hypothetical protein